MVLARWSPTDQGQRSGKQLREAVLGEAVEVGTYDRWILRSHECLKSGLDEMLIIGKRSCNVVFGHDNEG